MKSIFRIFFIFLSILFLTCKSTFNIENNNTYINEGKGYITKVRLLKNGEFEYYFKAELSEQISKGNWKKFSDTIILNSFDYFKTGIVGVEESQNKSGDESKITISDLNGDFLIDAGITINEISNIGWKIGNFGFAIIPKQKINSITIYYLGREYKYNVLNPESNHFNFKIRIDDLSYEFFENEKWLLKGNLLISPANEILKLKK